MVNLRVPIGMILLLAIVSVCAARDVLGQAPCVEGWQPGTSVNGVGGYTGAIAIDAVGNVYAGGGFAAAGSTLANNIAKWDGTSWSPLGAGVDGQVTAIAISGTDVYVGGRFTSAGGEVANGIARWDGSSWSSVGAGPGHSVDDLAISGSSLYAAGGTGAPDHDGVVSVWNGSTWSALGPKFENGVTDIAVSGTNLYASRDYGNQVYKWNGSAWVDLNIGGSIRPFDIAASGQELYVVGNQYLGPTMGEVGYVARRDDSGWTVLGSGMAFERHSYVHAVAVSGTNVYVTGYFSRAGGVAASNVAKWNGSGWSALGDWHTPWGTAVAASGTNVYFGGQFVSTGGLERRADGIAKWNGSAWSDLGDGIYTVPNAMVAVGGVVYAAGYFTTDGNVRRLVKWDGTGWQSVAPSFPIGPAGRSLTITALAISGSDFYVGGYWTSPSRDSWVGFVYKWNGSSWSELGTGMNASVFAVAVSGSDVYAGGNFTMAGGVAANRIAKWNGSTWQPLGPGMDAGVLTLELAGNVLYAGGYFFSPGENIAKWDGTSWSALGAGPTRPLSPAGPQTGFRAVTSIVVSGTDVYAAGGWDWSDYEDTGFVSKWNGSQWTWLLSCCGYVNSITLEGGELYAGRLGWAGDILTKWNGSNWMSTGLADHVNDNESVGAIVRVGGQIFVGSGLNIGLSYVSVSGTVEGGFSTAGCHVSANFARYSVPLPTLSGRVTTPSGLGLRNATVVLTDEQGTERTVTTSSFGNYSFEGVSTGETFTLTARSRRYRFATRSIQVNEDLSGVDLVGIE